MKRFMLIFCSLLITLGATAQSKLGSQTTKIAKDSTLIKIHDLLEDVDFRMTVLTDTNSIQQRTSTTFCN